MNFKKTLTTLVLAGNLLSNTSHVDIIIPSTRTTYDEDKKDVGIRLESKGTRPLLVRNQIDLGNDNADPGSIKAPFVSTPPVSCIEPKYGQFVKVMFTQTTVLLKNHGSMFWFNVLEVPPKVDVNEEEDRSLLQLAFRTRTKLLYRPADLQGPPAEATEQLRWQMGNEQGHTALKVNNPTPHYASFNDAVATVGGKCYTVDATVAVPLSNASFNVRDLQNTISGKPNYHVINDYDDMIEGSILL